MIAYADSKVRRLARFGLRAFQLILSLSQVLTPTWGEIFARGVGCNFLVCVGVYQAYMATEVVSKIIAIHLPIFTFVAYAPLSLLLRLADLVSAVFPTTTSLPTCFPFLYP